MKNFNNSKKNKRTVISNDKLTRSYCDLLKSQDFKIKQLKMMKEDGGYSILKGVSVTTDFYLMNGLTISLKGRDRRVQINDFHGKIPYGQYQSKSYLRVLMPCITNSEPKNKSLTRFKDSPILLNCSVMSRLMSALNVNHSSITEARSQKLDDLEGFYKPRELKELSNGETNLSRVPNVDVDLRINSISRISIHDESGDQVSELISPSSDEIIDVIGGVNSVFSAKEQKMVRDFSISVLDNVSHLIEQDLHECFDKIYPHKQEGGLEIFFGANGGEKSGTSIRMFDDKGSVISTIDANELVGSAKGSLVQLFFVDNKTGLKVGEVTDHDNVGLVKTKGVELQHTSQNFFALTVSALKDSGGRMISSVDEYTDSCYPNRVVHIGDDKKATVFCRLENLPKNTHVSGKKGGDTEKKMIVGGDRRTVSLVDEDVYGRWNTNPKDGLTQLEFGTAGDRVLQKHFMRAYPSQNQKEKQVDFFEAIHHLASYTARTFHYIDWPKNTSQADKEKYLDDPSNYLIDKMIKEKLDSGFEKLFHQLQAFYNKHQNKFSVEDDE